MASIKRIVVTPRIVMSKDVVTAEDAEAFVKQLQEMVMADPRVEGAIILVDEYNADIIWTDPEFKA